MNKLTTFLIIITIALSFILGATIQSKAQSKGLSGVMPFITTSNRLGLFDQNTGRVYVYDDNFSQCLFVGQIQSLGQAIQALGKS